MMNSYGYEDKGFDTLLMPNVLNEDNTIGAGENVVSPTEPSYPFDYEDQSLGATPMATLDAQSYYPKTFTVTVVSADETKGTVTGGGKVKEGGSCEISATAADGYKFSKWNDDVEDATRTISNVTEDMTFTATFVDA